MANEVLIDNIVSPKVKEQLDALSKELNVVIKQIETANKYGVGAGGGGQAKTIDEATRAMNAQAQAQAKVNSLKNEAILNTTKQTQILKEEARAIQTGTIEYSKMVRAAKEATNAAREMAAVYGANSKQAKAAAKEANNLNTQLKDIDKTVNIHNKNVGNYGSTLSGIGTVLGKLGITTGIVAAATSAFNSIINTSDNLMDEWTFTMERAKGALRGFWETVAQSDWKNLIKNIKEASTANEEFARRQDAIQTATLNLTAQQAKYRDTLSRAEEMAKNKGLDDKTRAEALERYIVLSKIFYDQLTRLKRKDYESNLAILGVSKEQFEAFLQITTVEEKLAAERYNNAKERYDYLKAANMLNLSSYKTEVSGLNAIINTTSTRVKQIAEVIKVENKNREMIDRTRESYIQSQLAESALYDENKKIINLKGTLTAAIEKENNAVKKTIEYAKEIVRVIPLEASAILNEIGGIEELEKGLTTFTDILLKELPESMDAWQDFQEGFKEGAFYVDQGLQVLTTAVQTYFDMLNQESDLRLKKIEDNKNKELETLQELYDRQLIGEKEFNAQKKQIDAQAKREADAEAKKQFEAQKKQTLIQMGINLAAAQMNIWGTVTPWYAAVAASAAQGILFTIEFEKVRNSKYQGYEKGRVGGGKERAFVGEKGSEYLFTREGKLFKTPEIATLTDLDEGTSVIPANISRELDRYIGMPNVSKITRVNNINPLQLEILSELKSLNKKPTANVNIDKHGFEVSLINARNRTNFINNHVILR